MMLDDQNTITPLQSGTIRACVKAIIINAVPLITFATGKTLDIDWINNAFDQGWPLLVYVFSMYYNTRAIKARMNATQTVATKGVTS